MKKNSIKSAHQKTKHVLFASGLTLVSSVACAEELSAITGASKWVTSTLISVALTVLGLQVMYSLWQVNQGQKEWRDVLTPICITAAIVSVPTAIVLLKAAMST